MALYVSFSLKYTLWIVWHFWGDISFHNITILFSSFDVSISNPNWICVCMVFEILIVTVLSVSHNDFIFL